MTTPKAPVSGEAAAAVSLALLLDGLTFGLTAQEIRQSGVLGSPDDSYDAFRKRFSRAQERLGRAGIVIREMPQNDGEPRYRVEPGLSYGDESQVNLTTLEALRLYALASCCLQGPFPYHDDLQRALRRLSHLTHTDHLHERAVRAAGATREAEEQDETEPLLAAITGAYLQRATAQVTYRDAAGRKSTRTLKPYGLFRRRGHSYCVALDDASREVRVFRVDRMVRVSCDNDAGAHYSIPADFDARDYMRLPFQYGSEKSALDLAVPEEGRSGFQALAQGCGTWSDATWHAEVSDVEEAAQWATYARLSCGAQLVGSPEVAAEVRAGLERVVRQHG